MDETKAAGPMVPSMQPESKVQPLAAVPETSKA